MQYTDVSVCIVGLKRTQVEVYTVRLLSTHILEMPSVRFYTYQWSFIADTERTRLTHHVGHSCTNVILGNYYKIVPTMGGVSILA